MGLSMPGAPAIAGILTRELPGGVRPVKLPPEVGTSLPDNYLVLSRRRGRGRSDIVEVGRSPN